MYAESNVTVMVSDMGKAVRFYTETLGLPLRMRWEDEYATVEAPGCSSGSTPRASTGPGRARRAP